MRPFRIPDHIAKFLKPPSFFLNQIDAIRSAIQQLGGDPPQVSIVIPAFNEEQNILRTLGSLSQTRSHRSIEIIVVNNNSTDQTQTFAEMAGAITISEQEQGIMHARNKGLATARGKYILNADADTIYPPDWVDKMILPLEQNQNKILVYGKFAFLSSTGRSRLLYYSYEFLGDLARILIKTFLEECILVMGFHSAFRREQGLMVGGFSHPRESGEDGELALKLKKFGKLHANKTCYVWTSDRRIITDGGFRKAIKFRIFHYLDIKKGLRKKTMLVTF